MVEAMETRGDLAAALLGGQEEKQRKASGLKASLVEAMDEVWKAAA